MMISNELSVMLDEKRSNKRRQEYLIKRGADIMYLFTILSPPKDMEEFGPEYKFIPVTSIGLVPDFIVTNNEINVYFERNPMTSTIPSAEVDTFINDTLFAKEAVAYILNKVL